MSRILYRLLSWLILFPFFTVAQDNTPISDSQFLQYLLETEQFDDAIFLAQQRRNKSGLNYSPEYYAGFAYYNTRQLDSAAWYLGLVPENSNFYLKSRFFQGLSLAYINKTDRSEQAYSQIRIPSADTLLQELKTFELSGLALLKKDYATFDKLSSTFTYQYYPFSKQETNLLKYRQDLLKVKKRSPLAAGLLSALVPGSGKVYAGQLGQGVAIFLQNTIFALQAYEGYRKDGPQSARFLIYGGLFSIFYISNVWGSVLSVKVRRQEMYDQINNQILFDMHIPLRTLFN